METFAETVSLSWFYPVYLQSNGHSSLMGALTSHVSLCQVGLGSWSRDGRKHCRAAAITGSEQLRSIVRSQALLSSAGSPLYQM